MDRRKFLSAVAPNGDALKVSPVDDFPVPLSGSIIVELDTGRVVELVIAELSMLYELGEIPDELTTIAAKTLFAPAQDKDEREREKNYMARLRLAKWVAARSLVNPRVVEKPTKTNEITINHLYHDEIWQIYNFALSPAFALDNFRLQQARHVAVVSGLQDVGDETEQHAEGAAATE